MKLSDILNIELSLRGMEKGKTCTITRISVSRDQVPQETKSLSIILEDLDFLKVPHGIDFYEFKNEDLVLENKFKIMPLNPPLGESHDYQLTVRAFDNEHRIIGVGTATQLFP